ncbi:MAG: hypothetical protein LH481_17800 [Burkholderiales bacterium]|nr:hypothetical protein [Burkholderiales bacterium]
MISAAASSASVFEPKLLAPPSRRRRIALRKAAGDLYAVLDAFAREGRHPVRDLLIGTPDAFAVGQHYPHHDIEDPATGCAWYYHAHDPAVARHWDEHGHFHCFMYTELLGPRARPVALPGNPDVQKGGLVHVIAISFDASGVPTRVFVPNRWVTDEWLYRARDVIPLIDRFVITNDTRFDLTSRWLTAILRVCQPQIAGLLRDRDRLLAERRMVDPAGFAEDRLLEVVSTAPLDLDAVLGALA